MYGKDYYKIGGTFMKINTIIENNIKIAVVNSEEVLIDDVQSALDFIATVNYETGCNHIVLNKSAICNDFFNLSTRLAGEILQKYINYHIKLAIIGDYSSHTSKSLKDFIYESNRGKDFLFVSTVDEAIERLS